MTRDHCTREGATRLALDIACYWVERGYDMPEFVVSSSCRISAEQYIHAIRSNMVNGLPAGAKP